VESLELSYAALLLLSVAAFLAAVLHGATGIAGGIVISIVLSHAVGIKAAIPITTCALIFSHASRMFLYLRNTDWKSVKIVLTFSAPSIFIGATVFAYLSPVTIAVMMALFLTMSFPVKAYAKRRRLKTSNSVLAGASVLWGILAGNVVGPGFVLAPFLLGRGMDRLTFVGSLATVVLCMNLIKLVVFGSGGLMTTELFVLGAVLGLATIPGNWLGKKLLERINNQHHQVIVDMMTVLMIFNFVYLATASGLLE